MRELLRSSDKQAALRTAINQSLEFYNGYEGFKKELKHFSRILSGQLPILQEADINSSGYIVDTLEASIWCCLRFDEIRSIVIAGVNLGIDTDTTGSIAGGLGGLVYGIDSIPKEWLMAIAQKDKIDRLIDRFVTQVQPVTITTDTL